MRISVAQIKPIKGDVFANMHIHLEVMQRAALQKVDALFFPELSLTGYEPELAGALSIWPADPSLDEFQECSNRLKMVVGVGMPTKSEWGIHISMIIFQPSSPRLTYSKQQLHADECPYFVSGNEQLLVSLKDQLIAPAICYESLLQDHAQLAHKLGAAYYMVSAAKPERAMERALIHYPQVAKTYSIPVLLSNAVGYCDNFESVGQSAVWTKSGILAGQLDNKEEGLLIFDNVIDNVEMIRLS